MSAIRCVLLHVSVLIPVPEAAIEWKQNFRNRIFRPDLLTFIAYSFLLLFNLQVFFILNLITKMKNAMELKILQERLFEYRVLLQRYADNQNQIETEKFKIMLYNNRSKHIILGIVIGYVSYLFAYHFIVTSDQIVATGLICFGGAIIAMRYLIGPLYDRKRKQQKKAEARLRFAPLVMEMEEIAIKMERSEVLPEKYKTLHAVSHLLEYIQNQRIDSLKEGLNLYESDLNRYHQQKSIHQLTQQQQQMIAQQNKMITQQQQMVNAQRTTNTLLWFK